MRKRIIAQVQKETASPDQNWLNVEGLAEVKLPQRTPLIQLSPHCCPVELRGGVPQGLENRRSGFSSTIRSVCGGSG